MFEGKWNWFWLSRVIPLVDIRRYPDLPWSKEGLSHNPTLTVDDIQSLKIKNGKWDWYEISMRMSLVDVRKNPDLPWDKDGLSQNPTLTIDDIQSLSIKDGKWDWINIQSRVPIIDVYTHPNLTWNRGRLSANKNIRISDLIAWHEIPPSIYKRWQYPTDIVRVGLRDNPHLSQGRCGYLLTSTSGTTLDNSIQSHFPSNILLISEGTTLL